MYTLAQIRALGTVIRNETRRWFNTGARIDEIIQAIIDHLNGIENEGLLAHKDLQHKNDEPEFQHVTQAEKTGFHTHNNKEYLDNYNPTLFATALQGEKADSALQSLPPNTVIDADYPAVKNKVTTGIYIDKL